MTTFAPHRDTLESFVDCINGGADNDVLTGLLAEHVRLYGPFGDDPVVGRQTAVETMKKVNVPAGVALQRNLAGAIGMQPCELRTGTCRGLRVKPVLVAPRITVDGRSRWAKPTRRSGR